VQALVQLACQDVTEGAQEADTEDANTVVPAAVRCICALLEVSRQHGCLFELLSALPDPCEDVTHAAFSVCQPA
jgi:hypothetical protein